MAQHYSILVDHRPSYMNGKYGLTIMHEGVSSAPAKELLSDEELRSALASLGYESEEITDILEELTEKKAYVKEMREFEETAVAALGF
jgi:Holliday junction resolvasome RuvABC DNA-binding subunit